MPKKQIGRALEDVVIKLMLGYHFAKDWYRLSEKESKSIYGSLLYPCSTGIFSLLNELGPYTGKLLVLESKKEEHAYKLNAYVKDPINSDSCTIKKAEIEIERVRQAFTERGFKHEIHTRMSREEKPMDKISPSLRVLEDAVKNLGYHELAIWHFQLAPSFYFVNAYTKDLNI